MIRHFSRFRKLRLLCLAFLGVALSASCALARDDFQSRHLMNLKLVDTEKTDLIFFSQVRLGNDSKDPGFYMFGPRIKHELTEYLQLGLHYSYVSVKINNPVAGRSEFKFQHRIEMEANPHFQIRPWLKFFFRNRLEFRWVEDKGSYNTRLRPKLQFEVPLKNTGPLKAFYINSEFFYNVAEHEYNENWTVPWGMKFKINDEVSLSLFYMIQHLKGSDDWSSNQIIGTFWNLSF